MDVTISTSYGLPELAQSWMALESRADGGFFLSWRWMECWLSTTGVRPLLVRAQDGNRIMALGLLTPVMRRRHFLSVSQLCLHETGRPECDAVMIEHNNFLMDRDAPQGLMTQILRALESADTAWDEIVLGGVSPDLFPALEAADLTVETDRISPHFAVDLSEAWEETLSANQRAQLRQSRSFAERLGLLRLEPAADTVQALDFFEQMAGLHTAYWQKRNKPGAFATDFSRAFHRALIASRNGPAAVELLKLAAGNEVLGFLYNFHHASRAYNYQSGFSYSEDNRHRPGLIAHAMAIERAKSQGLQIYDFLAGDAPYKARLGRKMGTMVWCRGQRDRPLLVAERFARRLYRGLRAR